MRLCLLVALLMLPAAAGADERDRCNASDTVRSYFEALGRNDFALALALTDGPAQSRTARMIGTLRHQAEAHHAQVEVRVRALELAERPADCAVDVKFDLDVIGRRWFL